ncbi:MAG: NAD-dependent epimerase/dehydratase family protein [Burkholderiales bacterium]|jgi:UDP-glucose 4-epimerase|nr:NAD-dependent epimerase/dehydratase family protein [Burkholderiales bacterium]
MKALVTGGAGFIGSHSVEALLAAGAEVVVLDNFSAGKRSNLPAREPRLAVVEGDIRDPAAIAQAIAGATHVLHLAAQVSVRSSVEDPPNSCAQNVLGFVNVLDAARRAGVKRVAFASSAAVYGTPRELPLTETSPIGPISPYGLEKLVDEQYAALFLELYGLPTLGLRYFNVYGPRQDPRSQYAGVISKFADAIAADGALTLFGDGGQTRDFVFVGDVARANVAALRSDRTGIANIGTGTSVTLLELVDALERVSGRKADRRFAAPVAGDIRESAMRPARMMEIVGNAAPTSLDAGLKALLTAS